jgi:capsular polysaccharide biosynthesis protein
MAQKSRLRTMMTARWVRWFLFQCLASVAPQFRRWMNYPTRSVAAISAGEVLEQAREKWALPVPEERFAELYKTVLKPAMENDVGDCATYAERFTWLETELVILPDCVISGRTLGIMRASDMSLVQHDETPPNWNRAKPAVLKNKAPATKRCFVLNSMGHYFHFFSNDVLPLMHFLDRHAERLGPISVVTSEDDPRFVFDTLKALQKKYPTVQTRVLGERERFIGVDAVWHHRFAETGWVPATRDEANRLRDMLLDYYPPVDETPRAKNVLISRGDARLRRLRNEPDLARALASEGFAIFTPEAENHREQIETFRAARTIVSVHGAALTNLLFCEPGARIIELFPSDRIKSVYLALASRLDLDYHPIIGSPGDLREAFRVDIPSVLAAAMAHIDGAMDTH